MLPLSAATLLLVHLSRGSSHLERFHTNGYWGNPSYKLPPEVNLLAVTHYLEAMEWQREIVKIHTIFGGKNPHPNYLVGGAPCSINPDEVNAINTERLNQIGSLIAGAIAFVEQVYLPDLMAIAGFYKDWAAIGGGLKNYLSYLEQAVLSDSREFSGRTPPAIVCTPRA